jgi:hypothetical protein
MSNRSVAEPEAKGTVVAITLPVRDPQPIGQ